MFLKTLHDMTCVVNDFEKWKRIQRNMLKKDVVDRTTWWMFDGKIVSVSQLLRDSTPQHLHHSSWLYGSVHASCSCRVFLSSALSFSTELTSLIPTNFGSRVHLRKNPQMTALRPCRRTPPVPHQSGRTILRTSCVSGSTKSRTRGQYDDMSSKIRRDPSHFASADSIVRVQMWWVHNWKFVSQVRQGDNVRHFHRQRRMFGTWILFCAQQIINPQLTIVARITSEREDFNTYELGPYAFVRNKRQNDNVNAWSKRNG